MKVYRIVIAAIAITVCIALGIFLFNQDPDFIRVEMNGSNHQNMEKAPLTATQNFLKNAGISIACGGTIYIVFYSIPSEYKALKKKEEDEQIVNK